MGQVDSNLFKGGYRACNVTVEIGSAGAAASARQRNGRVAILVEV